MPYNGFDFSTFLPITVLSIGFAIGNYFLAKRLGKSPILWVVQSLIPLYNFGFFYYVAYRLVFFVLDRLGEIHAKLERAT